MRQIHIGEDTKDAYEMASLLREIASKLEDGYTSGYYPHWTLVGNDEEE